MIAKQTVFLTGDRNKAVPEGHADAKFLLVREGHDIEEAVVEKHDAMDLVNSAVKSKPSEPAPSRQYGVDSGETGIAVHSEGESKPAPAPAKKKRGKK